MSLFKTLIYLEELDILIGQKVLYLDLIILSYFKSLNFNREENTYDYISILIYKIGGKSEVFFKTRYALFSDLAIF